MNITNIKNNNVNAVQYDTFIPPSIPNKSSLNVQIDQNDVNVPSNWNNVILDEGLAELEKKIGMTSGKTTVLDKPENAPINTNYDALNVLSAVVSARDFAENARLAHSNISASAVFDLLTQA